MLSYGIEMKLKDLDESNQSRPTLQKCRRAAFLFADQERARQAAPDSGGAQMYNPDIHHRRSIRLQEYYYSGNGAYFDVSRTSGDEPMISTMATNRELENQKGQVHILHKNG